MRNIPVKFLSPTMGEIGKMAESVFERSTPGFERGSPGVWFERSTPRASLRGALPNNF